MAKTRRGVAIEKGWHAQEWSDTAEMADQMDQRGGREARGCVRSARMR